VNPDSYESIALALTKIGLSAQMQGTVQLVVSCQQGAVWPSPGNSFWLTHHCGEWLIGTWLPVCYRLPASADVVALCVACMEVGNSAMYRVPDSIIARFGLREISDDEYTQMFRE
jgi:hypothetical protein